jgi:hypothetical protein
MRAPMMARPVAHYLAEFGAPPLEQAIDDTGNGAASVELQDEPVAEDPTDSLQAARDEGIAEGYGTARSEYEAQFLQERLAFEARLTAERDKWTRQESIKLSGDIKAAFAEVESRIAGSVECIIRPFIVEALRRKMIDLLAENIGILLSGRERPVVEIHGPEDLLAALRKKLSPFSCAINYSPEASIDVRVVADQTMIESRIGEWLDRIRSLPE